MSKKERALSFFFVMVGQRAGTAIDASHKILFSKYSNDNIYFLIDSDAFSCKNITKKIRPKLFILAYVFRKCYNEEAYRQTSV